MKRIAAAIRVSIAVASLTATCVPIAVHAQDGALPATLDTPWSDTAPALDQAADRVIASAVGLPDERFGRLAARRAAARRSAEDRARAAIHRWADDALAQVAASASIAAAVHRAIDDGAVVSRVRSLSDGGAVIEIAVPLEALRVASSRGGLPWSR